MSRGVKVMEIWNLTYFYRSYLLEFAITNYFRYCHRSWRGLCGGSKIISLRGALTLLSSIPIGARLPNSPAAKTSSSTDFHSYHNTKAMAHNITPVLNPAGLTPPIPILFVQTCRHKLCAGCETRWNVCCDCRFSDRKYLMAWNEGTETPIFYRG